MTAAENTGTIEAIHGPEAAAEWRVLLNQFIFGEGFSLIILSVPGPSAAALCRSELTRFLAERDQTLSNVAPADIAAFRHLTSAILALQTGPNAGAVWIDTLVARDAPLDPTWNAAWEQALGSLNQQRNPLRRAFAVPVILVCVTALEPTIREIAPDLWSVRALSIRIGPALPRHDGLSLDPREPHISTDLSPPGHRPHADADPDFARAEAEKLRDRPDQALTRASLLARAAEGFAARYQWPEVEAALLEAIPIFEHANALSEAASAWTHLGDTRETLGRSEEALLAFERARHFDERIASAAPGDFERQRDLSVSHNKIGEVKMAQGDLAGALAAFGAGMEIARRLAEADPGNAGWQRDLAVSHHRLGSMKARMGDEAGAVESLRAVLGVLDGMAARGMHLDPAMAGLRQQLTAAFAGGGATGPAPDAAG